MTGRTHDLAAATALTIYLAYQPLPTLSLGTLLVSFGAICLGRDSPRFRSANSRTLAKNTRWFSFWKNSQTLSWHSSHDCTFANRSFFSRISDAAFFKLYP